MAQELGEIETTQLESLLKLRDEQKALTALIDKADAMRDQVAPAVYQRVVGDYRARAEALEGRARPLREQAGGELRKLRALHAKLRAELDKARLDLDEVAFRRQLGELDETDFAGRHQSATETVARCQAQHDAADAVLQRFLEAIPAEPAGPAQPGPSPAAEQTVVAATTPDQEDSSPGGTQVMPRGGLDTFETAQVRPARLVLERDGSPVETHLLGPVVSIGRTSDNQIAVVSREVSRRHATVEMTPDGYRLTDLDSGNGTFVNDQRIKQCLLRPGDSVRFGDVTFVFQTD